MLSVPILARESPAQSLEDMSTVARILPELGAMSECCVEHSAGGETLGPCERHGGGGGSAIQRIATEREQPAHAGIGHRKPIELVRNAKRGREMRYRGMRGIVHSNLGVDNGAVRHELAAEHREIGR